MTDRLPVGRFSRRALLRSSLALGGLTALGATLGACSQPQPSPTPGTTQPSQAQPTQPAKPTQAALTKATSPTGKLTIVYAASPVFDELTSILKEETGWTAEWIGGGYDENHNKITVGLAGGAAFDVVTVDTIWTGEFAQAKFLIPLDEAIPADVKKDLLPHALNEWSYNGKSYAVPHSNSIMSFYYNEKLLTQAGLSEPPKTWEDVVTASKTVMSKTGIPFGMAAGWKQLEGLTCYYNYWVNAFKGEWQDKDGKWIFNQGGGLKALQFMADILHKDKIIDPASVTMGDRDSVNIFINAKIAFMPNWGFAYQFSKSSPDSKIANDVRVTLMPGVQATGVKSSSTTGGNAAGVTAVGKQHDIAIKAALLFADPRVQKKAIEVAKGAFQPARVSMYDDPWIKSTYPEVLEVRKQYDTGHRRPPIPWYYEWSTIVQKACQEAFTQAKTPQKALDDAVKQINDRAQVYKT